MPWIEKTPDELARDLGIDIHEVREKLRMSAAIEKRRKEMGLTQAALAKRVGLSQSRIAQIEAGVGTAKVTFDVLLNILRALGVDYRITLKRRAA